MIPIEREEVEARIRAEEDERAYFLRQGETNCARRCRIHIDAMRFQLAREDDLMLARRDEIERCSMLNDMLAGIHEASAARIRKAGEFTTRSIWPPFKKVTFVMPRAEKDAQIIEAAARSLRASAACMRAGYDPRTVDICPLEPTGRV